MKPAAYKNYFGNHDGTIYVTYTETPVIHDSVDIVEPLYAIYFTKYKLVPLEPTEEMIERGDNCLDRFAECPPVDIIYEAMLEAAPDIEDL